MRADYHMHTSFSKDAHFSPEEMIEAAIQKGLQTICITDHMDKDVMIGEEEFIFDTEEYLKKNSGIKREIQRKNRSAFRSGDWTSATSGRLFYKIYKRKSI